MITMIIMKMRTVFLNDRGQVVIPEDVRKDLRLQSGQALVLFEVNGEILLKKESSVVKELLDSRDEKKFWQALSVKSLENAGAKDDEVWDSVY